MTPFLEILGLVVICLAYWGLLDLAGEFAYWRRRTAENRKAR
jgi:hypothetical protein